MKLSRHIKDLKQSNVYTSFLDAIVKEIEAELAATPPPAPAPAAAEPGAVPPPTPPSAAELLEMVRARATRLGDGRPFGAHGTVGEYRETVKAVTKLMDDKVLTPSGKTGSKLAAEIGVKIGPRRLHDLAKKAPGESPPSSAAPLKLGKETEHSLREYIMTLREADIVETKEMIKSEINNTIAGTPLALTFPDGKVTDKVYYAFLDRCDLYTGDQVPLEDKRVRVGALDERRDAVQGLGGAVRRRRSRSPQPNLRPDHPPTRPALCADPLEAGSGGPLGLL